MSILHFCNTFFEWELASDMGSDLKAALEKSPIFSQLQFLPYLYAHEGDGVLVSQKPLESSLPTYTLDEYPPYTHLETWGYSLLAKQWAEERKLIYPMPQWDLIKMVNSKTYSFAKSPLPGSRLIYQGDSLEKGKLLKSCFGTAGRGHMFSDDPKALNFCQKQWDKNLPVIAEPFVEKNLDFSSQWIISPSKEIAYLGATICITNPKGVHESNLAGKVNPPHLEKHQEIASFVLEEMAEMGYFGYVGFDAMIYGQNQLQPIVEINARKTMGLLTLMVQQKKYPKNTIKLSFLPPAVPGILPTTLGDVKFSRQIHIQIVN